MRLPDNCTAFQQSSCTNTFRAINTRFQVVEGAVENVRRTTQKTDDRMDEVVKLSAGNSAALGIITKLTFTILAVIVTGVLGLAFKILIG